MVYLAAASGGFGAAPAPRSGRANSGSRAGGTTAPNRRPAEGQTRPGGAADPSHAASGATALATSLPELGAAQGRLPPRRGDENGSLPGKDARGPAGIPRGERAASRRSSRLARRAAAGTGAVGLRQDYQSLNRRSWRLGL